MITVYTLSHKDAWETVRGLIDGKPYAHDDEKSKRAGYHIYTFSGGWVSDLGDRLEVNYENGCTYSVWIEDRVKAAQHTLSIPEGMDKAKAVSLLQSALAIHASNLGMLCDKYVMSNDAKDFDAYMDAISTTADMRRLCKANKD